MFVEIELYTKSTSFSTVNFLKKRWKNLRDTYVKIKRGDKGRSGEGASKKRVEIQKKFVFFGAIHRNNEVNLIVEFVILVLVPSNVDPIYSPSYS